MLGESASTSLLAHLYRDEAGRKQRYQGLNEAESMKKALGYLDKGLLLAPKSLSLYQTALHYQSGFEDFEAMLKLQQRFRTAEPDLNEFQQEELAAFRGAKDKEYLEKYQTRIRTLEGLIQAAALKEHPLTLEHVSGALN